MGGRRNHSDNGFWEHLKASAYNPAKITVACEADCSSGVAAIVKAVGYLLGNAKLQGVSIYCYTGNLRAALKAAGFEVLTESKLMNTVFYKKSCGFKHLDYREHAIVSAHLRFCMECYSAFLKGEAFIDIAVDHGLSSPDIADKTFCRALRKMEEKLKKHGIYEA